MNSSKMDKPEAFDVDKSEYGITEVMKYGFTSTKARLSKSHPLENVQFDYKNNQDAITFNMLGKIQGLHAPLKLKMERKLVSQAGGRLPFLQSSNASYEALTGADCQIGFEDFLNSGEFKEQMCQPHAQVEKMLGIL